MAKRKIVFKKDRPAPPKPKKKALKKDEAPTSWIDHAITRARERYGLHLSMEDLDKIIALIEQGSAELVKQEWVRSAGTRRLHEVYLLTFRGKAIRVVYRRGEGVMGSRIATFLPYYPTNGWTDRGYNMKGTP